MENINWDNVHDANFPTPGAYAAKITKVEDKSDKQYLMVYYEICQGNFKGYCQDTLDTMGFWPFRQVWSYKTKALWFFKQKKMAVEESNSGFQFRNDPQSLVGKFCAIVLGEEEYRNQKGEKKKRLYVADLISGKKFREGQYEIPGLKKLEEAEAPGFAEPAAAVNDYAPIEDDDAALPF